MDEIERLLSETEADARVIAEIAIRLSNRFGLSSMLSDFIARANQIRDRVARQRLVVQQLKGQITSPQRSVKIQLLHAEVNQNRIEVSEILRVVRELDNDI